MKTKKLVTILLVLGSFMTATGTSSANISFSGNVNFDHDHVVSAYVYDCPVSLDYTFLSDTVSLSQFDPGLGILNSVELTVESTIDVETHYWYDYDSAWGSEWWYSDVIGSVNGLEATFFQGHQTTTKGQGYHDHAFTIDGSASDSASTGLTGFIGTGLVDVAITGDDKLCAWWNHYDHIDTDTYGTVTATLIYNYTLPVGIDIKPTSCPNPLNVKSRGILSVAILGNALNVDEVDVSTILLEGVSPLRWDMKDVATPFEPYIGREDAMDCTTSGPDGFMDLTLKFDTQEIVAALGDVSNGQVVVMQLTGNLLDGTPIVGEDVVVIISKAIAEGTLPLTDDDYEEVPLGFTFPYQGQEWTSVFVNSNGNLTFGSGDTDFSESVGDFLNDQPRIAALWVDLNPGVGGEVTVFSERKNSLTVSFIDVPEWPAVGANNFSITLRSGGQVDIVYGAVLANDGLVGLTEGGGAADPGETDLSEAKVLPAYGTTYEQFSGGDSFDLDDTDLRFRGQE